MLYIIYYQNNILEGPKYYLHEFPSKWSVGGIVVSIVAFQAIDPGSIPGQRIFYILASTFALSNIFNIGTVKLIRQNFGKNMK